MLSYALETYKYVYIGELVVSSEEDVPQALEIFGLITYN